MKRPGIRTQLLLITLIPVFLVDVFFTYINVNSSIDQARGLLESKGKIISQQIAGAAEFNIISGNDDQLLRLLTQSINKNDVVKSSVLSADGTILATVSSSLYDPEKLDNYFYYRQPIELQSIDNSDIFAIEQNSQAEMEVIGWVHLYVSQQRLYQTKREIIKDSFQFFLIALALGLVLAIFIGKRITQPIIDLKNHLQRVEAGQLGETILTIEKNEIGAVQNSFNRMTESLKTSRQHLNDRIQQATLQLSEAITDLESKNRELGFAKDEAQSANETKSAFLANMSHEIRTPINGIKGFIGLMISSNLDSRQQYYADIILKSTNDLISIIDEILDFSKVESGKLEIIAEPFNLHELLEQTRDILFINALTKGIDLNLIIYSDTPKEVIGDKLRLKQIILNLLSNAIKFTDKGRVVIRVSIEDEFDSTCSLRFDIEDTGTGVSEEDQKRLFKAFSQTDVDTNRRFTGTGLGLVISRNLAQLMGGDISLESEPGQGSTFTLVIPFQTSPNSEPVNHFDTKSGLLFSGDLSGMQEMQTLFERCNTHVEATLIANNDLDEISSSISRNINQLDFIVIDMRYITIDSLFFDKLCSNSIQLFIVQFDPSDDGLSERDNVEELTPLISRQSLYQLLHISETEINSESKSTEVQSVGKNLGKSILLVDDNEVNLKLASELIKIWGHSVQEANHANRAMQYFNENNYDLIVLDIQMPEIDGTQLLKMMRAEKDLLHTPIVALTANALETEKQRLLELGFDFYLSKPINELKFRSIIEQGIIRKETKPEKPANTTIKATSLSFDYEKSLALSANSRPLFLQIVQILLRDIPDIQEQLHKQKNRIDIDNLNLLAHKLQGITCYASLPKLKAQLIKIQVEIDSQHEDAIENSIDQLIEELNTIEILLNELETESAPVSTF